MNATVWMNSVGLLVYKGRENSVIILPETGCLAALVKDEREGKMG